MVAFITVTFIQKGDFYNVYGADAELLTEKFGIKNSPTELNGKTVPYICVSPDVLRVVTQELSKLGMAVSVKAETPTVTRTNEQNMPVTDENTPANEIDETTPVGQLLEDYNDAVDNILSVSDKTAKEFADKRVAVKVLKNTPTVILDNVKDARDLKVIINYNKLYLAVRKDGVFKEFCKKAINHSKSEDIWNNIGEYIKSNIYIPSSAGKSEYHIDNYDNKYIYLSGTSIQGYKIPISDVKKAYESKLWEGGQKNGNDSYTAALAKYIYEKVNKIISFDNCTKNFVFIIDEINRGEISKLFGELFYSIDPGYRGKSDKTLPLSQYHNLIPEGDIFKDGFYVPDNVYIIGTMNDIDRSVESMDFAFRRRFAFIEIKAEDRLSMLDELKDKSLKTKATNRLKNINKAISEIECLSPAYHIGASYFLKLNNYEGHFELLWEYHIEGLLREYLRGMRNVDDTIKELKKAYDNESAPNN